jgi:hypothetical protein
MESAAERLLETTASPAAQLEVGALLIATGGLNTELVGRESKVTAPAPPTLRSQSAPEAGSLSSRPPSTLIPTATATATAATSPPVAAVSLRTRTAPMQPSPPHRRGIRDLFQWRPRRGRSADGGAAAASEEEEEEGVARASQVLGNMLRQGTQPVMTALCPICYCNVPAHELYTTSERCGHRFCKDCLGGWITVLVTDGKVNQLFCPFDASMCDGDGEQIVGMWNCLTCTLKNPELSTECSACNVPKDMWRCGTCTLFNDRPALPAPGAESKTGTRASGAAGGAGAGAIVTENDIDLEAAVHKMMRCSGCRSEQPVLPPPVHPAASGKCGILLTLEDVAALTTPDVVAKYERFKANLDDPNNRDCPNPEGCDHRQIGRQEAPTMTCEKCSYQFCFEHSNAHPGHTCRQYEAKIRDDVVRMRHAVKAMGARPCPHCKCDTLKNSGCNHMTCSAGCRGEWCWLCGRKLGRGYESVSHHYDPTNVLGCGGMQMDYGATPGCAAVSLRRVLHFLHMFVAACLAFVCCILGGLTVVGVCCSVCLPCFAYVMLVNRGPSNDTAEAMLKLGAGFALFYGAIPALCCVLVSLFFGMVLNAALLPLTLFAVVWSFFFGDVGADRVEIGNDRARHPMSQCETALRIIFMPFIVNFEELKLLTGQQEN